MHTNQNVAESIRAVELEDDVDLLDANLYVGTQYLKAFYGLAVADYSALKRRESIAFSPDDSLEIFCIAPWQVERFNDVVDVLLRFARAVWVLIARPSAIPAA